jgi:hypothetical protein
MSQVITIKQENQLPITKENVVELMKKPKALHEKILEEISSIQKGIDKYKQEIVNYKLKQAKPREYYLEAIKDMRNKLKELKEQVVDEKGIVEKQEKTKALQDAIDICSQISLFPNDYENYLRHFESVYKKDKSILSKINSTFNQQAFDKKYLDCIKFLVPMANVVEYINNNFNDISQRLIVSYYNNIAFTTIPTEKLASKLYYVGDYSLFAFINGAIIYMKEKDKFFDFANFESILKRQQKEAEVVVNKLEFFAENEEN